MMSFKLYVNAVNPGILLNMFCKYTVNVIPQLCMCFMHMISCLWYCHLRITYRKGVNIPGTVTTYVGSKHKPVCGSRKQKSKGSNVCRVKLYITSTVVTFIPFRVHTVLRLWSINSNNYVSTVLGCTFSFLCICLFTINVYGKLHTKDIYYVLHVSV